MRDKRFDPSRDAASHANGNAIQWFKVYTAWTDVIPTGETTPTDQYCTAKYCHHNSARTEWVAETGASAIYDYVFDPQLGAKPAIGDLIRAVFNPERNRWELFPSGPAPHLQYYVDKPLDGWSDTSDTAKLNYLYPTGYTGSRYKCGDEQAVGIEYDVDEAAPGTNGNYLVLKDGYYRVVLSGTITWDIDTAFYWGPAAGESSYAENSRIDSGGDTYTFPNYVGILDGGRGPKLSIGLWNKRPGIANAAHADEFTGTYYWFGHLQRGVGDDEFRHQAEAEWHVNLTEDDRLSLCWTIADTSTYYRIEHPRNEPLRLIFERLGAKQAWTTLV